MSERKMLIVMEDSGRAIVDFVDDCYFSKRELLRIISTIKVEHRQKVRLYRRNQRVESLKKEQGNNERRESGSKQSVDRQKQEGSKRRESSGAGAKKPASDSSSSTGNLAAAVRAKQQRREDEGPRSGSASS
jgi:hypothetical protein